MFRLIQLVALIFILALSLAGIAILFIQPLSILTCRYVETKQVDCQLQERIVWLIPVRERPITHLKKADVRTETSVREDQDGDEYTVTVYRVVLISASGEIVLQDTGEIGLSSELTAARINDYLSTPTGESLTVWGYNLLTHTLVTLVGGAVFFLFGFGSVVAIVSMVFGPGTVAKVLKVKQKSARTEG
jgi:hypothetical protein